MCKELSMRFREKLNFGFAAFTVADNESGHPLLRKLCSAWDNG